MPLVHGKSKKTFEKNVKTEVESGKPLKQSLAIAYDIQRKAKKKAKKENPAENASTPAFREYAEEKMAHGGEAKGLYANIHAKRERIKEGSGEKMRKPGSEGAPTAEAFKESEKGEKEMKYAHGGHVCSKCGHEDMEESDLESGSLAQKMLARKKYAKGGEVLDEEGNLDDPFDTGKGITQFQEEGPSVRQKYNMAARKYIAGDSSQISPQPRNSNLKGRELDGNDDAGLQSIAAKIMKKKKKGI